jgi:hypothetical protein
MISQRTTFQANVAMDTQGQPETLPITSLYKAQSCELFLSVHKEGLSWCSAIMRLRKNPDGM